MKVELEKHQFGSLLEKDIATAVNNTELAPYTLNGIVLKVNNYWYQLDHLIMLPHKIVVIEAKNSTSDSYIVGKDEDSYTFFPDIKSYGSSIVRQTSRTKETLKSIFRGKSLSPDITNSLGATLKIEVVGCIRCYDVQNEQVILPIYTDETIWYYLKSLESELKVYNPLLIYKQYQEKLEILKPLTRTSQEYKDDLIEKGLFNTSKIRIPKELAEEKDLTLEESDGGIRAAHTKREQRLNTLKRHLTKELGYLPSNYREYALQHKDVSLGSLVEYYCTLDLVKDQYPNLPHILNKISPYVRGMFIVDYCKTVNVFFIEVIHEYARIYHTGNGETSHNPSKVQTLNRSKELNLTRIVGGIQYGYLR